MSSNSEDFFTHGGPSHEADTGKQERKNVPGDRKSNQWDEGNEKKGGAGNSSMEKGGRNRRRDLGRAAWRYVCHQYPNFSMD